MTDYELKGPFTGEALHEEIAAPAKPRYRERLLAPLGWWVLGIAAAICATHLVVRFA